MKIQCDVCNTEEASVFCTADEAALCDTCDHRVHHANKLASKHQRFSLLHPSSKNFPICDICQEKRAFLFCQQDRAILCRDCDGPIHTANEHTQKHNRFLLTGVKLSATSAVYISSSSVTNSGGHLVPDSKSQQQQQQQSIKKPVFDAPVNSNPPTVPSTLSTNTVANKGGYNLVTNEGFGSTTTSTISEYLMETLPGWHVEDFLDSSTTPFGFCKIDDVLLPFMDTHDLESNMSSFSPESLGLWVPQAPSTPFTSRQYYFPQVVGQSGFKEIKETTNMKADRRLADDVFTVPQISLPTSISSKRSRPLW
ncbi:PREDICTED: B-box zinc finger protein 21-like [Populus euphratica]|uniref:B-box zinc finger protein 21-like n=1 Tax=Populus euphratica TaxID=75702 RepID=A0AAJ6XRU0_POPEU|nr:PREDICTED: B-box zinc finger protein 21-like [Populus euphratica]